MTFIKTTVLAAAILALGATTTQAQGKSYGKQLTLKEKTPISAILKDPKAYNGKRVQVEGTIVEVCEERGCWIKIASDKPFESIRFKVDDGVIVFPLDAKGKLALAEGVVTVRTLTRAQQVAQIVEMAKERKTTPDTSKVTEGAIDIQIKGEGARVKE